MHDCPKCGAPVDGLVCGVCGEGGKAGKTSERRVLSANHWQTNWPMEWNCSHVDRGQRCANPGAFSESLHGGGPWFCKLHYPPFAKRNYGPAAPPPKGWQSVRDALQIREPGSDDA